MKIICLLKFVPDVDSFEYDYEKNVLVRENVKQILNPEDACALGFALKLKKTNPDIEIGAVTMAPHSVKKFMEDVLRRHVDKGTLISDPLFAGSDTLATSLILGTYLKRTPYDVILTGSQTLDGDTAQVPAQIAEFLNISYMSGIMKIDEQSFLQGTPQVEVDTENHTDIYELTFPSLLAVRRESKYRLPFVRFADLELDVSEHLQIIDNQILNIPPDKIGLKGSPTRVVKTYPQTYENKEKMIVQNDEEGIETVYCFLKEKGYIK